MPAESTDLDPRGHQASGLVLRVDGLESVRAVSLHHGTTADLVRALKYRRSTVAVTSLADRMAVGLPPVDAVTWVPASPGRRRRRGFDQAELLARAIARRSGVPARRTLRRGDDVAQTARDAVGRAVGPRLAPAGRRPRPGIRLLLVDDVMTTGATLRAAATVLHRVRGVSVHAVVATVARSDRVGEHGPASTI